MFIAFYTFVIGGCPVPNPCVFDVFHINLGGLGTYLAKKLCFLKGSSKVGSKTSPPELPGEALGHPWDPLGAPWFALGTPLGPPWEPLGAPGEPLGALWGALVELLGAFWEPLGASRELRGAFWEPLIAF